MLRFTVKSVTEQDDLTVVVVEPAEQSLLLSDEIPAGCIQHIVSALQNNKDPKDTCSRLCNILSKVHMDDVNSRKQTRSTHSLGDETDLFRLCWILADSTRMFRDYGGVELLCKLFKKHKDLSIAMALAHVLEKRSSIHSYISIPFKFLLFVTVY